MIGGRRELHDGEAAAFTAEAVGAGSDAAFFAARRADSVARRHAPKLSKPWRCHSSMTAASTGRTQAGGSSQ